MASEVAGVELQLEIGLLVTKVGCLLGHRSLFDLPQQAQIQQAILLLTQKRELPLDFFRLESCLSLLVVRPIIPTAKSYGPWKDGVEVVLIEIEGGGHTWPGQKAPISLIGKSALDISPNDLMWDFFLRSIR